MEKIKFEDIHGIDDIKVKEYVSVRTKLIVANKIADTIIGKLDNGQLAYDLNSLKIVTDCTFVSLYTNIDTSGDFEDIYDFITENKIIHQIQNVLGYDDLNEFKEIINNEIQNRMTRNNINNIIADKANDVVAIIDKTMSHVNGMLDKGDPNIIAKHLSGAVGIIASKLPDFSKIDVLSSLKGEKSNGKIN